MTRIGLSALAAVATLALAPSAHAAVSVVNGSFEMGPDPGLFTTLGNGNTAITGWEVGGDSIDYIGTYWQPSDGERSIDLAGNDKGSIFQTLAGLTIGHQYVVNFDLAGNPDGGGAIKTAVVSQGGNQASVFTFSQAGNTRADMGWETKYFYFTAFDTTALLAFSATENNAFGPALDNIGIRDTAVPVPEPASWALMIAGFGGVGAALRSKRRLAFA